MTAQIIELNTETKPEDAIVCSCCGEPIHDEEWTEDFAEDERDVLANMFMFDLIGETQMCECDNCGTRGEEWMFQEGCPDCGEIESLNYNHTFTAEDFVAKWTMGWGWVFGADLSKPMGCIGNMPWGYFDTTRNTLTYDNGKEYVTVALPPDDLKILNLQEFGLEVFEAAQVADGFAEPTN